MALLGDDGRGYELARRLEGQGVWRSWLGDSLYTSFIHFLSTPTTWDSFMRTDDSKSRAQIQLQLRVRALLFDKASISLFLHPSIQPAVSKINPNYLQLHGDDVYFTLENSNSSQGVVAAGVGALSKVQSKAAFGIGPRYGDSEVENMSQRFRLDDFPETWYNLFFEKYRASKPYRLSTGDRETEKRTPEQMSNYMKAIDKHKRRRAVFKEEQNMALGNPIFESGSNLRSNSVLDDNNALDDEIPFFPETAFSANCIPDSALPLSIGVENNLKVEFNGVLDNLPQIMTRSPIMIERLGIRPEYLNMEQGSQTSGKNGSLGIKNNFGPQQAAQMSQKVIAHLLTTVCVDATSELPMEVLSQLLSCHISKLGRTLKVLADSYRKQCSALELLKMFLQTIGHGNFGALAEHMKDNAKHDVQQTPQQVQAIQSQLQSQQQTHSRLPHQVPRQMHQQLQQMVHPLQQQQQMVHSLQQQQQMIHPLQQQQQMIHPLQQQQQMVLPLQQQQILRRRQAAAPRSAMNMNMNTNTNTNTNMNMNMNMNMSMNVDKERPMVEVKLENPPDFPMDSNNAFSTINSRQAQLQFRQQQLAAMSNIQARPSNQFRQLPSSQMSQIQTQAQTPNTSTIRAQPVKVEGFQELMSGDSSLKHESEETELMSPK